MNFKRWEHSGSQFHFVESVVEGAAEDVDNLVRRNCVNSFDVLESSSVKAAPIGASHHERATTHLKTNLRTLDG